MTNKKKVFVLYTDAGGGHLAMARAIQAVLDDCTYEVTLFNPYDLFPEYDFLNRLTSCPSESIYNKVILEKGWKRFFPPFFYGLVMLNMKLFSKIFIKRAVKKWVEEEVDLIISVIPLSNSFTRKSIKVYEREIPFVIVLTDFNEVFKYSWFPKEQDYFVICPTDKAEQQLLRKPHPKNKIFKTQGLMIHPDNYQYQTIDVKKERLKFGLKQDIPTGCLSYGSYADAYVLDLAKKLNELAQSFQVIFICGRNEDLAMQLEALDLKYPHLIKRFTERMPFYLNISDFFIGKPGPQTISEALVANLPLLIDGKNVMMQEKFNLEWVVKSQLGLVFKSTEAFLEAFSKMINEKDRVNFRNNVKRVTNQSIFQLPDIISDIFNNTGKVI